MVFFKTYFFDEEDYPDTCVDDNTPCTQNDLLASSRHPLVSVPDLATGFIDPILSGIITGYHEF